MAAVNSGVSVGERVVVDGTGRLRDGARVIILPARAPWVEEFKKEILSFPASKHDDQIDALSQALQRAFAPGPPVAVFGTYSMGS